MLQKLWISGLLLFTVAPAGAADLTVCGTAETADGSPLPAAARAELTPLEGGHTWALGVLDGRPGPEPEATAAVEGGRYCLAALRAGMWKVVVRAPGLVPMSYSPLAVSAPVELPGVRLPRDAGSRVTVRHAGDRPAAGVWVAAGSATPRLLLRVAEGGWRVETRLGRADEEGRVALPRLDGEELEVAAFPVQSLDAVEARAGATGRLELPRAGRGRTIQVRDEGGEPVPGVAVTLADHGWPVGVTDGAGRLAVAGGSSGAVPLVLEAEDGRRAAVRLPEAARAASEPGVARLELAAGRSLRGRVLEGPGRRPLAGAMVWLAQAPGAFAVTGADGAYALPAAGWERPRVHADAAGFLPRAAIVEPADLAAGRVPELVLQPAAAIVGRVVDSEGAPLAGVRLEALAEGGREPQAGGLADGAASHAWSDADGRFELFRLRPALAYRVAARRPGFAALVLPGVTPPPRSAPTDLGTLVLHPGARLEGRVSDLRGRPLEGAEVRIREASGRPGRGEADRLRERPPDAVTGPDGRFALRDLRPGRPLHLLTSRSGYLPAWTPAVEAPAPEPLAVVLEDASRLAGTLVDEAGAPVAGARVGLRWLGPPAGTVGLEPRRGGGSRVGETGPRGAFSFEELAPGGVEVSARAEGFLPGEPVTLELPPAGEVADVRLVLHRGAVVEGRVLDPSGAPVEGARLRAGLAGAAGTSGADGAYRLEGVRLGVQGLFVHHPGYRRFVREIHVEPGVNAEDVFLEDGWSVSGQTVDEDGAPVAGASVELRAETSRAPGTYEAESGEDGAFRVVVSEEGGYHLTAVRDGFARSELGGLEVRSGSLEGVEVVLVRGASVVGSVLGLAPEELAAVSLEARREGATGPGSTVAGGVDHRGGYVVHHLAPGDWRVRAAIAGGRREAAATVTVDAGTRQVERDLEFGSGLRLAGRLLFGGEPVAGAHVSVTGLDVSGERSILSAYDGSFRLEDLAPGRYRLDVLDSARALSHVEDLELTSDRELVLELRSAPLVGTVVSAEGGEPLEDALIRVRKVLGAGGLGPLVTVATDAAGGFVVAHVAPGLYLVSAGKEGYAPAEEAVEVAEGAAPPPVVLRLPATGGLTLQVHLENGGVPRAVTVSAFDRGGAKLLTDTRPTTDRGYVYFDQIPAGAWNLLVTAPGAASAWITAEVPGMVPPVSLPPAAPLTVRVPALMEAGAAGILTVAAQSGEPFFQVEPAGDVRSRWTLSGGLVTVDDLPAGVWTLRVEAAQGATWLGTAATDGLAPSQVSLE
jgi:protocatechuate 3,4-dioxygenase beta subunit